MATRLESGQVQLRGAGGVPMSQVQVPQIDFTASRAESSANAQLAQALDRMASQVSSDAVQLRYEEGWQFAANNPLTDEQFAAAKNGQPLDLGNNPFSSFDKAVKKARSLELASHFEIEGMSQLVQVQAAVEEGTMTAEQATAKVQQFTDGLTKSIAKADADAAYKFRATMATHGNAVLQHAYRTELQRAKQEKIAKFDMSFDHAITLLETAAQENPDNFPKYADGFRQNVLGMAMLLGDAGIQKEYSAKVKPAMDNAQVNAVAKHLMKDEFMADPRGTINKLRTGDVGIYSNMVKNLMVTDFATYQKIEDKFTAMVKARKEGIELALVDSNVEADQIMRSLYSSTSAKQQKELYTKLINLPVKPEVIKAARDFIYSDDATGPQHDDLMAFGRISQRVALGLATPEEINRAPLTRATKKTLMQQWANPNDDVSFGVNQINLAVGIQSSNLPPELKSADARQLAVETRNVLVMELTNYARTPNEKGMLPMPSEVRNKSIELAQRASKNMSKAFGKAATTNNNTAVLMLPELQGVDLNNDAAVEAAISRAVEKKRPQTSINAARSAIEEYRANMKKVEEGKQ